MSETELRAMVRELLREVLAGRAKPGAVAEALPVAEPVRITTDQDLAAFVRLLIQRLDDPAAGAAIRSGRHRFTLAVTAGPASTQAAATASGPAVLSGTVTEARVERNSRAGTLILAPGAVMTPLARDRARALGLKIERRS